ncbi:MAG: hypothetical protein IJK77_04405 [Lachnospiraceae bacterium]|nr:hypothetical protein [Lachnospiraceae bacterium]
MKFEKILKENPFTLVVSLPNNKLDLARAALDAGADAVKVHINVLHAASGNLFGDFEHNRSFLTDLVKLAGDRPVGVVTGGADEHLTETELPEFEGIGIDFFSCYSEHLPVFMLKSQKLTKMVAIHDTYDEILDAVADSEIDVVEASIMKTTEYGKPLRYFDVLQYRKICQAVKQPVLVPTQKGIRPEEVFALKAAGCRAVMIGANVMRDQSAEACYEATLAFRRAVDALK